jgi:ABC-2 type transport system permease protein
MIYLGWVFYPLTLLSPIWNSISQFNPILYMVNWLRYAFIWISDVNIFFSIWIILLFIIALSIANIHLIKKWYGIKS